MQYKIIKMVEEKEIGGRDFVGVASSDKITEQLQVTVPYGVDIPSIVDKFDIDNMRFLKRYVKCIQKALNTQNVRENLEDYDMGVNHPLAAVRIIYDYITMGLLVDFTSEEITTQTGKMDVKRTIQKKIPEYVKGSFVYEQYISQQKRVIKDNYVAIVQGNIINHFMEHGGEILFGSKLRVPVKPISLDKTVSVKLKKELQETFNSRKQMVIHWMIDYLSGIDFSKNKGKWDYAIIASTLWENMITSVYGNKVIVRKTEYGKKYPFVTMKDSKLISIKSGRPTQHDTIYEDDGQIIIIDAKMYGSDMSLLSSEVLDKQFGYYSEAKKKNPSKRILNILFTPVIKEKGEVAGFLNGFIPDTDIEGGKDPDRIIFIYKCDANALINDFYFSKKRHEKLREDIEMFINVDGRDLLDARGTSY